jgi:hypothetical protein
MSMAIAEQSPGPRVLPSHSPAQSTLGKWATVGTLASHDAVLQGVQM